MTLLIATLVSIYSLMVVGAYVTIGGYGGGCGTELPRDWPFCHGQLIPNFDWPTAVEYSHRLLTVLTTVLLFVTTFAVSRMRPRVRSILASMEVASVLLVAQIVLGGVVVGSNLDAVISTLHLANSMTIFGLVVAATVLMWQQRL
jgi:cytochrome c oxidase assembly protein subunit 15